MRMGAALLIGNFKILLKLKMKIIHRNRQDINNIQNY